MSYTVHPTAIVDKNARLSEGVEVGPYSIIGAEVTIGPDTKIGPHVVIDGRTTIGARNNIFQFASIGAAPQDLKYKGEPSTCSIGDGNTIRECVTIHRGTEHGNMATVVGNRNLLMACSHVAHDCKVGDGNVFANSVALAGHVEIGNHAILGGLAGIHQFARVGDLAFVGAGAMVGMDVPPFAMAQGDRCHLRGINVIGLRRAGFTLDDVNIIKRLYRHLFYAKGSMSERLASLPADLSESGSRGAAVILQFVRGGKRGYVTPRRTGEEGDESEG